MLKFGPKDLDDISRSTILRLAPLPLYLDALESQEWMNSDPEKYGQLISLVKETVRRFGCRLTPDQVNTCFQRLFGLAMTWGSTGEVESSSKRMLAIAVVTTARVCLLSGGSFGEIWEQLLAKLEGRVEQRLMTLSIVEAMCTEFMKDVRTEDATRNSTFKEEVKCKRKEFLQSAVIVFRCDKEQWMNDQLTCVAYGRALEVIKAVFTMFVPELMNDNQEIRYPDDLREYFRPDALLQVVCSELHRDGRVRTVAIEVLMLMLRAADKMWVEPDGSDRREFFMRAMQHVVTISLENQKMWSAMSRLLMRFVMNIPTSRTRESRNEEVLAVFNQYDKGELFKMAQDLTLRLLVGIDKDNSDDAVNMLKFWKEVSRNAPERGGALFLVIVNNWYARIAESDEWITKVNEIPTAVFKLLWWKDSPGYWEQQCEGIVKELEARSRERLNDNATVIQAGLLIRIAAGALSELVGPCVESTEIGQTTEKMFGQFMDFIAASTDMTLERMCKGTEMDKKVIVSFHMCIAAFISAVRNRISKRLGSKSNQMIGKSLLIIFEHGMKILQNPIEDEELVAQVVENMNAFWSQKAIVDYVKGTPAMDKIISASLSANFCVNDVRTVKKARIQLHSMYMPMISGHPRVMAFLTNYDKRFEAARASPDLCGQIGHLYTELRGLFQGCEQDMNRCSLLLGWFSGHTSEIVEDVKMICMNGGDHASYALRAVSSFVISIFPDRLSKTTSSSVIGGTTTRRPRLNSSGCIAPIKLFRIGCSIMRYVDEQWQARHEVSMLRLLFKLIKGCLTSESVNFGVMSYYQDASFPETVSLFFERLRDSLHTELLMTPRSLQCILAIITNMCAVKCIETSKDEGRERVVYLIGFLRIALSRASCGIGEDAPSQWNATWEAVNMLMNRGPAEIPVDMFRPYITVILDTIINREAISKNSKVTTDASHLLMYMYIYDREYMHTVVTKIQRLYGETSQAERVGTIFVDLFSNVRCESWSDVSENNLKDFVFASTRFRKSMRSLPVDLREDESLAKDLEL